VRQGEALALAQAMQDAATAGHLTKPEVMALGRAILRLLAWIETHHTMAALMAKARATTKGGR
jgi:hypothetical protein